VRFGAGSESIYLKSLHLIDIVSIAPRDTFFKPVSWKVNTGFDREMMSNGDEYLIFRLNTGGGFSYRSPFGGIWYALGEMDINAGSKIRSRVAGGPGFSIGSTEQLTPDLKLLLNAGGYWYGLGDDRHSLKASLGLNLRVSRNNSLNLESSQEYVNSRAISEVLLRWNYYY
jgi:hypothetical protein